MPGAECGHRRDPREEQSRISAGDRRHDDDQEQQPYPRSRIDEYRAELHVQHGIEHRSGSADERERQRERGDGEDTDLERYWSRSRAPTRLSVFGHSISRARGLPRGPSRRFTKFAQATPSTNVPKTSAMTVTDSPLCRGKSVPLTAMGNRLPTGMKSNSRSKSRRCTSGTRPRDELRQVATRTRRVSASHPRVAAHRW